MQQRRSSVIAFLSGLGAEATNTNPIGNTNTDPIGNTNTNPAGNTNTDPVGHTNTDPPGGQNTNTDPEAHPKRRKQVMAFDPEAIPTWEGLDAPWTYENRDTLLMQALRKSRAKISRRSDPRGAMLGKRASGPDNCTLWRWAPPFRASAVTAELHSRLQVHGRSVWLAQRALEPAKPVSMYRLLEVPTTREWLQHAKVASAPASQKPNLDEQIDSVLRAAYEREDRLPEILLQARGLWPFFESVTGVQLDRAPAFFDLLVAVEDWTVKVLMALKNTLGATRPVQVNSLVMPIIETPGHGSMPSGHATQAAFNGELIGLLMYHDQSGQPLPVFAPRIELLDRLARRIAFNRVVAGLHFPVDNVVGYAIGRHMARAVAALAEPDRWKEPLGELTIDGIFEHGYDLEEVIDGDRPTIRTASAGWKRLQEAPNLSALWKRAADELARLRV